MDIWRFFSGHTVCNPEIGPQNQKSALPQLFGLTTAFPNGMTQPGSTNDHLPAPLQGKGQGAGQGLLGGAIKRRNNSVFQNDILNDFLI